MKSYSKTLSIRASAISLSLFLLVPTVSGKSNPLALPEVGQHALTILSPSILELSRVTTKA
ncbi:MAG TPA: hypothetical protein VK633_05085, partial [Verrucomicrobiae bacterium]|nr:hypothetical protein [Verrucomicrobiae bacterium]